MPDTTPATPEERCRRDRTGAPAQDESPAPASRNVLFITADQWRGDCLSAQGHPVRTPHLDELAADGVLFERHFANTAPCGPSRASLHTGLVQRRHGVMANGMALAGSLTNWAIEARGAGHEPVLFGYTDTLSEDQVREPDADLSVSDGVLAGLEPLVLLGKAILRPTPWATWLQAKGWRVADPAWLYTNRDTRSEDDPAPLEVPPELHDTRFLVDSAIDYIARWRTSPTRRGWCVHLSLLRPHPPWIPPAPYHRMYPPNELPRPERGVDADQQAAAHPYLAAMLRHPHARAPDDSRQQRWQAGYYGLMTEVDDNLGRLFGALKRLGEWNDTLIVFTSDHGEQMGDQHLIGKLGFFDASYSVPLIIRNPSCEAAGTRVTAFTESIDIAPTLLDWLGIDIPEQFDGASLLPFTAERRPRADWRSEAHWEFHFGHAAADFGLPPEACGMTVLRGNDYRCVAFDATQLPVLYQPVGDEQDTCRNLAGDPGYSKRVGAAQERMVAWQRSHVASA